jgi:hypothetical protein
MIRTRGLYAAAWKEKKKTARFPSLVVVFDLLSHH